MSGSVSRRQVAALFAAALGATLASSASAQDKVGSHAQGRAVYERWCAPCHDPGKMHPGTNALTYKYPTKKSPVIAEWTDLPAPLVKHWVRHGVSVMPQFRKTEVSDSELDALALYLSRNTPTG
jgi:mono/diheme cytochrome c family protein